ncbi:46 kDa FK506-binding nuclear protein-like [Vespa crabro]|uniref:46 kDa FK506-binding nuclear protein-like n=1 Tax=Vespa crabro TaxID=7445 RepID=UPI001F0068E3|nr:46 kDa FK506-binding nuclear protein-like [Vespa crabro]
MFWGLIMEPKKRYSQTVEIPFHLSMATLDTTTGNDEIVQVTITYNDTNYLLCNLKKSTMWQVSLDLNFEKGNEITFICNGESYVHLTGYLNHKLILKEQEERNEDSQIANKQIKRKAMHYPNVSSKPKRMKCEIESSDELQSDYSEYITGTESEEEDNDEDEDEYEDEEGIGIDEMDDSFEADDDDEELCLNMESIDVSEDKEEIEEDTEKENKLIKRNKKNKQIQQQDKMQDERKLMSEQEDEERKQDRKQQKKKLRTQNVLREIKKTKPIRIKDIKIGNGAVAKSGKLISIYYTGKLKNGKKFDESKQGNGFKFKLGRNQVIKGWDIGIIGMKVGGKRQIIIPPAMGYGARGLPPYIPGNSTLEYEIELRNVQ